MMVIELEIPDQNIDTEGETESQIKVITLSLTLQNVWLKITLPGGSPGRADTIL